MCDFNHWDGSQTRTRSYARQLLLPTTGLLSTGQLGSSQQPDCCLHRPRFLPQGHGAPAFEADLQRHLRGGQDKGRSRSRLLLEHSGNRCLARQVQTLKVAFQVWFKADRVAGGQHRFSEVTNLPHDADRGGAERQAQRSQAIQNLHYQPGAGSKSCPASPSRSLSKQMMENEMGGISQGAICSLHSSGSHLHTHYHRVSEYFAVNQGRLNILEVFLLLQSLMSRFQTIPDPQH